MKIFEIKIKTQKMREAMCGVLFVCFDIFYLSDYLYQNATRFIGFDSIDRIGGKT